MSMHIMELPRRVIVGSNIVDRLGSVLSELELCGKTLILSGPLVKSLMGPRIETSLKDSGFSASWNTVGPSVIQEVDRLEGIAKEIKAEFLVGVGGGRSIDTAKLASFKLKVPFVSVPTSASHDGISSPFGSVKGMGRPYSVVANPPICIFADIQVISKAPRNLLVSGCGDLISKRTAVLDWELSHEKTGEYFGSYSAALAMLSAKLVMDNKNRISSDDSEGVRTVVEALISSGVAAGIAGSSRPCSGSEHLFSHALDLVAPGRGMHGEKCGIGTIMMAKLHGLDYEEIRDFLIKIGGAVSAEQIGLEAQHIVEALVMAREIRKERYTILDEVKLTKESALELARETRVI